MSASKKQSIAKMTDAVEIVSLGKILTLIIAKTEAKMNARLTQKQERAR